jgi:cbb3-type cytochrome oxidase maturation protein
MEVLIYLVPLALGLGLLGLAAFLWTLKSGQYDDLDGAGWRAILDEEDREDSAHAEPQTHFPSPLAGEGGRSE